MATFRKRGEKWQVRFTLNGKEYSGSFKTKAEGQAWAALTETEIRQGEHIQKSRHNLKDAINRYAETVAPAKRGFRWENIRLNAWQKLPFADTRIADVDAAVLADWRDARLKIVKSSTVNRELNLMSSVFEVCRREWRWIKHNPVHDVKRPANPPHRQRIITDEEITSILSALGYIPGKIYTRQQVIGCALIFAIETGMRRDEITSLEWDRVFLGEAFVRLETSKNGDARDVPLSTKAGDILCELKGFDFEKPFDVDKDVLSTLFRKACITAGVKGVTFHDARHTATTRLAKKLNPFELARMLGHRDMKMTLKYFNETAADIAKRLD